MRHMKDSNLLKIFADLVGLRHYETTLKYWMNILSRQRLDEKINRTIMTLISLA